MNSQRVAMIPGGARGIGKGLALALADRGYAVAIAYRKSATAASEVVQRIEAQGGQGVAYALDVSTTEACEALVQKVLEKWGRIDAFVMAAGAFHKVDLVDETPEGFRAMFANNLDGFFYLSRLVAPVLMHQGSGRMLAFALANADRVVGQTQITAHYLAKLGVMGLVRAWAKRLAPHGITVNAIAPGIIDSGTLDPSLLDPLAKTIPAARLGTVDDAVAAGLFLLSDEAAYVNGTCLHVSGGWGL